MKGETEEQRMARGRSCPPRAGTPVCSGSSRRAAAHPGAPSAQRCLVLRPWRWFGRGESGREQSGQPLPLCPRSPYSRGESAGNEVSGVHDALCRGKLSGGGARTCQGRRHVGILQQVAKEAMTDKQRPEGSEGGSQGWIWGKSIPDGGQRKCKYPGVGLAGVD